MYFITKLVSLSPLFCIISWIYSEYTVENAFPNLSFVDPVGIYHAGDDSDKLYVVEQPGTIKRFSNDQSASVVQTFLDLTPIVNQGTGYTEEGLLGLAFHPNYSENGYFYVNYTDYGPNEM